MHKGIVYLVGAGPGDPGLITVKGLECLGYAEVVIYDYLVSPELLDMCPPDAEKIYVGKTVGRHSMPQSEINALIVEKACSEKVVVRLKGGDPYIFGRGGEEAWCLHEAGIPFEVIPGITASFAAATYSGIPLTHRDLASSVGLVTGHEKADKKTSALKWEKLATGMDTIAFYMGMTNLPFIVEQLMAHGRKATTPVAVIRWGTTPRHETLEATLDTVVDRVRNRDFKPPAVIIIGEVVGLRKELRWFDNRPLFGKRVLAVKADTDNHRTIAHLRKQGAEVVPCPFCELVPPLDWRELDSAIAGLSSIGAIIFTSAVAVQNLVGRLKTAGKDIRALSGVHLVASDLHTAAGMENFGLRPDLVTGSSCSEELAAYLLRVSAKQVLYLQGEGIYDTTLQKLSVPGTEVVVAATYRCRVPASCSEKINRLLAEKKLDAITFSSATAVKYFLSIVGVDAPRILKDAVVFFDGFRIADTPQQLGLSVIVESASCRIGDNIEAFVKAIQGTVSGLKNPDSDYGVTEPTIAFELEKVSEYEDSNPTHGAWQPHFRGQRCAA